MAKQRPTKSKSNKEAWRPPSLEAFEKAWVIEDYMSSELTDLLQGVYLAMADAFEAAKVKLTPAIYKTLLPAQALKLTVHLGGFPSSEIGVVTLGGRKLTPEYKDELMRSLDGAIEWVGKNASGQSVTWKHPTPPETIDPFLKKARWHKTDLIKKVSGIDEYVCETTKQFLKRLYREPTTNVQFGIDPRTHETLKKLRDVMAEAEPELCRKLTIADLRWTPE